MKRLLRAALVVGLAAIAIGAAPNWNTEVIKTAAGHRVGNPDAKLKLVAFESYTCPHCGEFEREGEGALRIVYIHGGNLSLEVRHIIRDPVDLTAAVLVNCGTPDKFFANHAAFMLGQRAWLGKMQSATQGQVARWNSGTFSARRQAIASDLGFYAIMANRGYERPEIDRCLTDNAAADALSRQAKTNGDTPGVDGTPTFALNGTVLDNVHTWRSLQTALDGRL
jgi:protein-disulfide isomerase